MKYALNLSDEKRILSAWVVLPGVNYDGMPVVEHLPDGNLADYRYIDNAYVYDPMPSPEPVEPEQDESLESRVSRVESDVANLTAAIEKGLAL